MENKVPFRLYLGFHWSDFLKLSARAFKML